MDDTNFIEKCFNEWMKEHPDSSYAEFRLLCRFWIHTHDSVYGKVYADKEEPNVDYKKLYEERLKEKHKKQELDSAYGKFAKTPKEMFDEGWCKDCFGDIRECLKKGKCEGNESSV